MRTDRLPRNNAKDNEARVLFVNSFDVYVSLTGEVTVTKEAIYSGEIPRPKKNK